MANGKYTTTTQGSPLCREPESLTKLKACGKKCEQAYKNTVLYGIGGADADTSIAVNGHIEKIGPQSFQLEFPWHQAFQLDLPSYVGRADGEAPAQVACRHLQALSIKSTRSGRKVVFTLEGDDLAHMEALVDAQKERNSALKGNARG